MKRLFFALWPDAAVRTECCAVLEKIPPGLVKPVPAANLHVTLQFLGQVNPEQEQFLIAAAGQLPISTMSLLFDRLDFWQKPAVLCLSSEHYSSDVSLLAADLAAIARQANIRLDDRLFRPHITLARKAKQIITLDFKPIVWRSQAFCLVESCSGSHGVEYRVLQRWGMADYC